MLNWIKTRIELAVQNANQIGESSTRGVFLLVGICATFSATFMTLSGTLSAAFKASPPDGAYWLASGALWTTVVGFATGAKVSQNKTEGRGPNGDQS